MVLSMLATPFLIMYSNRIVMQLVSSDWLMQSRADDPHRASRPSTPRRTSSSAGYGRSGQNLARLLEHEHIPYMALDLDPDRVRQATAAGQSVVFGDAARLQSADGRRPGAGERGGGRATTTRLAALKMLRLAQAHAPQVPVIVRTQRRHRPRDACRPPAPPGWCRRPSRAR